MTAHRCGAGGVHRARRVSVLALTAAAIVVADQTTKTLAVHRLSNGPIHLFGSLSLALSFNSGVAFSIGTGRTTPIVVISALLVVVLVWFGRGAPSYPAAIGTGMILGGALGNLADRVFRGHSGAVVDFIHTGVWPTFNVADVAIVGGVIVLFLVFWRQVGRSRAVGRGRGGRRVLRWRR